MSRTASDEAWWLLDVTSTRDAALIRRAYADRLKLTDPEGFQRLRAASRSR